MACVVYSARNAGATRRIRPTGGFRLREGSLVMLDVMEQYRARIEQLCRRFGVRRLEIFGSAATGQFEASRSDLDFLAEFEPASPAEHADRYFGLLEALEDLFGRRIDLVEREAIRNPYFRRQVEASRVLVYAA